MQNQRKFHAEGDYLIIYEDDPPPSSPRHQRKWKWRPRFRLFRHANTAVALTVALVAVCAIAQRLLSSGVLYWEQGLLAILTLVLCCLAFYLISRRQPLARQLGVCAHGAAILTAIALFGATTSSNAIQWMAIRTLRASGSQVLEYSPEQLIPAIIGKDLGKYFSRCFFVDVLIKNKTIPKGVLEELNCEARIKLAPDISTENRRQFMSEFSQAVQKGLPFQLDVMYLDEIPQDDLALLESNGYRMQVIECRSPLTDVQAKYLQSPNLGPGRIVTLNSFTPSDFAKLNLRSADSKGSLLFVLNDCQLTPECVNRIAWLAANVAIVENAEHKSSLTAEVLDTMVQMQLPVYRIDTGELDEHLAARIAMLRSIGTLSARTLDSDCVNALASSTLRWVQLVELTPSAIQAMVRNKVSWMITAEKTNAEFEELRELIQLPSIQHFQLRDESQFSELERVQLDK
jgi:hypothetical protein